VSASLEEQIAAVAQASLRPVALPEVAPEQGRPRAHPRRTPWVVAAAALVVLVVVVAAMAMGGTGGQDTAGPAEPVPSLPNREERVPRLEDLVGAPAPALVGTAVDGTSVSLASLSGSWVVVDVFATWCIPCRDHLPALLSLAEDDPHVEVLTLVYDDDLARATSWLAAEGVTWPVIAVDGRIERAFRLTGLPTSYVIDPDGVVVEVSVGGQAGLERFAGEGD